MRGCSDRVAHVVQRIEGRNEVKALERIVLGRSPCFLLGTVRVLARTLEGLRMHNIRKIT